MDEACAYAQLQLLHGYCPLVLFRGADSVREFEQICLIMLRQGTAYPLANTAKVMKKSQTSAKNFRFL